MSTKPIVIIQTGGKGTRLAPRTDNIPKCLVSVGGRTLLQRFIDFFGSEIVVISDHLHEILSSYIEVLIKQEIKIVRASKKGTLAGISDALTLITDNRPIILVWSDLLFTEFLEIDFEKSTIGLSRTFDCRYQYTNQEIIKKTDNKSGIAGFFVFPNKTYLSNLPDEGSFVGDFLISKKMKFEKEIYLDTVHEIGTLKALVEFESKNPSSRFFNTVEVTSETVIKKCIHPEFENLLQDEIKWYKFAKENFLFTEIPELLSVSPLTLEKRKGTLGRSLSEENKKQLLAQIATFLIRLHGKFQFPADKEDVKTIYLLKSLERSLQYKKILHFSESESIFVNGQKILNPIAHSNLELLSSKLSQITCDTFAFIHGDLTFSNCLFDPETQQLSIIDPRGSFGKSKLFGDPAYDWAKLYYSAIDLYDVTNERKFSVVYKENEVWIDPLPEPNSELETEFWSLCPLSQKEILTKVFTIWLSLIGYLQNDIDGMNYAFYRACLAYERITKYE